jgi:toxin ParE1/3/4
MPKFSYVLSDEADQDIEDIFDFSAYKFSVEQAIIYLENLEQTFKKLVDYPEMGVSRNELKVGLYSLPMQSHIIFYRIVEDRIRIVRVLHHSRDVNVFKDMNR